MPRGHFTNCIIYVDTIVPTTARNWSHTLWWRYTPPIFGHIRLLVGWKFRKKNSMCLKLGSVQTSHDEKDDDDDAESDGGTRAKAADWRPRHLVARRYTSLNSPRILPQNNSQKWTTRVCKQCNQYNKYNLTSNDKQRQKWKLSILR